MKKQLTVQDHIELSKKFFELQNLYNEINYILDNHLIISDPILVKFQRQALFSGFAIRRNIKQSLDLLCQKLMTREEIKKYGSIYFNKIK